MNYHQFVKNLTDKVRERASEGETVEVRSVPHNNSTRMDSLTISYPGRIVVPNIYLEPFFARYKNGEDMDEIADEVVRQNSSRVCLETITYGDLHSFDRIRESLRFRLISRDLNEELLRSVPHRPFMDLEMICYYRPDVPGLRDASALVQNGDIAEWEIMEDELFQISLNQTIAKEKPLLRHITDVVSDEMPADNPDDTDEREEDLTSPMFVLSNKSGLYGASCMAYPDLFRRIADQFNMDFWVLPSSIHELILLPDDEMYSAPELSELVKSVNLSSVPPWEVLSDSVYHYDRKHRLLTMEIPSS